MSAAVKRDPKDPKTVDDDAPTMISTRDPRLCEPPPLPFSLRRKKSVDEWLKDLPVASRLVLEMVRSHQGRWPRAARVPGAVAQPIGIPSIDPSKRRR